jgi:hypothetical protein
VLTGHGSPPPPPTPPLLFMQTGRSERGVGGSRAWSPGSGAIVDTGKSEPNASEAPASSSDLRAACAARFSREAGLNQSRGGPESVPGPPAGVLLQAARRADVAQRQLALRALEPERRHCNDLRTGRSPRRVSPGAGGAFFRRGA